MTVDARSRRFAVLAASGAALLTLVAYLLVWQRGHYMDDYSTRFGVVDPESGARKSVFSPSLNHFYPTRLLGVPVSYAASSNLVEHEGLVRGLAAAAIFCNALLIGWLMWRLLDSPLAAAASCWLSVAPFYACEAVLWAGAYGYLVVMMSTLAYLHAGLSFLWRPAHAWRWFAGTCVLYWVALQTGEQAISLAALFPILALPSVPGALRLRARLLRSFGLAAGLLLVAALVYATQYRGAMMTSLASSVPLTWSVLSERLVRAYGALGTIYTFPWIRTHMAGAFEQGWLVLSSSRLGVALALGSGVCMLAAVALVSRESPRVRRPAWSGGVLAAGGVVAFALSFSFPAALMPGQLYPPRLYFIPMLGAVMTASSLAWLATRWKGGLLLGYPLLAGVGACSLWSGICMLGYAHGFALRASLDQRQVRAFVQTAPAALLPEGVTVIPFSLPIGLFERPNDALSKFYAGVFSTPWSARGAVCIELRRNDIAAIAMNSWGGMTFAALRAGDGSTRLRVQDTDVDPQRALPFTYRGQRVLLISTIELRRASGDSTTFRFPIAEAAARAGSEAIAIRVPEGQPVFDFETISPPPAEIP